jgi:hypothetical protein
MKIKLIFILLWLICLPVAAQSRYKISINGINKNVPAQESQGKIWVDLAALASSLGLELEVNLPSKTINLNQPAAGSFPSRLPTATEPQTILWGNASFKVKELVLPCRNMRIFAFAPNAQLSESLSYEQLESSVSQGKNDFLLEQGLIKSVTTDLNGYYSFENLSPGNLLLVAKYSYNNKTYLWRVPCTYSGGELRIDLSKENQTK